MNTEKKAVMCEEDKVFDIFMDKETNTRGYLTEQGKVIEFYDFERPGQTVWSRKDDIQEAKIYITQFYQDVLAQQKRDMSLTMAIIKKIA